MLEDAVRYARNEGFRQFPVVSDKGELVGIVTQSDIMDTAEKLLRGYTRELENRIEIRNRFAGFDILFNYVQFDLYHKTDLKKYFLNGIVGRGLRTPPILGAMPVPAEAGMDIALQLFN